jgi:hypothetical protein
MSPGIRERVRRTIDRPPPIRRNSTVVPAPVPSVAVTLMPMNGQPQPEERAAGTNSSLRAALTEAADRIEELLAAAEDAAVRIAEQGEAGSNQVFEDAGGNVLRAGIQAEERDSGLHGGRGPSRSEPPWSAVPAGRLESDGPQRLAEALNLASEVVQRAEAMARDARDLGEAASQLQATVVRMMDRGRHRRAPAMDPIDQGSDMLGLGPLSPPGAGKAPGEIDADAGDGPMDEPGSVQPASRPGGAGEAQLLAVQMAVAGSTDAEIERRLRHHFAPDEVNLALDAVRKLEPRIR